MDLIMKQMQFPEDVRWIGVNRRDGFPIETSYFKTVFNLVEPAKKAILRISANTRYILYVNGHELIHGPCKGDYWHQFCDTIDITTYLKTGANIVAAKVTAFPPFETNNEDMSNAGPFWAMTGNMGPMLIVHSELEGADISTGRADWYFLNDEAIKWNFDPLIQWMGCTEIVDGKSIPQGWQTEPKIGEGFTKALVKWSNTVRYGEVNPLFLYERPIEQLLRKEISGLSVLSGFNFPLEAEVELPANGTYEAILTMGDLTTSFIYLNCKNGAGSKISLFYSEAFSKYGGDRRENRYYKENRSDTSGELRGVADIYFPGGGEETYSPSWFRTFRFIRVTIETGETPLTVYPLKLVETRYPLENKVRFESNQSWLKPVWDMSLRTLELCMHETYEDCPFYEQLQYTMDTRLQMLFTYIISGEAVMQRKTIHDYHTSMLPEGMLQSRYPSKYPQIIPPFSLHWIYMLKDYYMETGDIDLLERYRPTMESILAWFKRKTGPQGLIEHLGYWDFADWADAWDDIAGMPRASLHGPSAIQNLAYCFGLEVGAWIMDTLDCKCLAERYRAEKAAISEKVEVLCWAADKGLYREGPAYEEYSQHAQLWAVLSGLAKGERAKEIMGKALSDDSLVPCSFVLQFYLFRALEEAGMYEETEKLWDQWKHMIDMDCVTVPEIPGKYVRSECHAWGALILHELPRKFLGISPLTPGYGKLLIKPVGLYMKEISGAVPTPFGKAEVKWRSDDKCFKIEGKTPVSALVVLPDGSEHEVEAGNFVFEVF